MSGVFPKVVSFFDRLMRRYTPDPFVLAVLLTFGVFAASYVTLLGKVEGDLTLDVATNKASDLLMSWGTGFWNPALNIFTLQMAMVLVAGYAVAVSRPAKKLLSGIASLAKTDGQAVVLVTLTACIGCWLNWGLGLMLGAMLCHEVIRKVPTANFRLLVASAYTGFLVWHGGLSGSIPLGIAAEGNFAEKAIGGIIPITETVFSPLNITAVAGLLILLPLTNYWMGRSQKVPSVKMEEDAEIDAKRPESPTPAERLEYSPLITLLVCAMGFAFLALTFRAPTFKGLNLNIVIFMFLFLAVLLHGNLKAMVEAVTDGASRVGPILLQFPFYGGILHLTRDSGLVDVISNFFVQISTTQTYDLYTFYSAGLLNLFVPSGGGQWVIQAPIVIDGAKALGTDVSRAAMAVAWGDAWTNMLQPFWALPILAVSGLKIRDIMGYCVGALIVSGLFLSLLFVIF